MTLHINIIQQGRGRNQAEWNQRGSLAMLPTGTQPPRRRNLTPWPLAPDSPVSRSWEFGKQGTHAGLVIEMAGSGRG